MFANDYRWFTFGGLLGISDAVKPQDSDVVAAYNAYPNGIEGQQFRAGYELKELPQNVSRYISAGAATSAPSENLGFYFGGLHSASFGPIYQTTGNASRNANVTATSLIELDMTSSTQTTEKWTNDTLAPEVPGRASAEVVWVPVSSKGILVAIGGATFPYYATAAQSNNATTNARSKAESVKFLSTVSVYDVASRTWYEQETSGAPLAPLAQGCTVLASTADGSTHNIYWYGGFDGVHPTEPFSDDVWVLSIPSFTWVKASSGKPSHSRAGHRCVKPYPDQMFVIGGYTDLSGGVPQCVEDGIVQIFNLSSATWIDEYNPTVWSEYTVPPVVAAAVGGKQVPTTGFATGLKTVFDTKYDRTKIKNYFPYEPAAIQNTTHPTLPSPIVKPGSKTPSYLAPVLGVVLGLFFITLVVLGVLLWRRRKYLQSVRNGTQSESGTLDSRFWVGQWLRGTPNANDAKAPTVTTDQTEETYPSSPYDYEELRSNVQEVGDTQVHEMMGTLPTIPSSTTQDLQHANSIFHESLTNSMTDTSVTQEIDSTGFVPLANKPRRGPSNASSLVSSTSSHRPPISPIGRPDSPPLGNDSNPRITSGVSDVSGTDRGHLRGISETSVSTQGGGVGGGGGGVSSVGGSNYATPMAEDIPLRDLPAARGPTPEASTGRPGVVSPLTPPDTVNTTGDYLGARNTGNAAAKRKSNFEERLE